MPTGKVVRVVSERGFGFIKPDEGGDDIFFHITGIRPSPGFTFHTLRNNHPVSYDIATSPKGRRCENITDADAPPADGTSGYDDYRDTDRRPSRRR